MKSIKSLCPSVWITLAPRLRSLRTSFQLFVTSSVRPNIIRKLSLASHWGWVHMKQVRVKFEINWVICHKLNLSVEPLVVEILKKWTEASEYFSPPRLITSKNLKDRVEYHLLKPQDTRKVEGRLLSDKNMLTMPPPFSVSLRPHWEVSAGPDRGGLCQEGGGAECEALASTRPNDFR